MKERKVYATVRENQDSESVLWTVFQDGSFERGKEFLDELRKSIVKEKGFLCDSDKESSAKIERSQEEYVRFEIEEISKCFGHMIGYQIEGWDTDYPEAFTVLGMLARQDPPFDEKYGDDEDDDISKDDERFGKQKVFVEVFVDNPWKEWPEDDERRLIKY